MNIHNPAYIKSLEELQDSFYKLSKIASYVISPDGAVIVEPVGFGAISSDLDKSFEKYSATITKRAASKFALETTAFFKFGCFDFFLVPIVSDYKIVAYFIGGLVVTASLASLDSNELISDFTVLNDDGAEKALRHAAFVEKEMFEKYAEFAANILGTISALSDENSDDLSSDISDVDAGNYEFDSSAIVKLSKAEKAIKIADTKVKSLNEQFDVIKKLVSDTTEHIEQTEETLKQIQDVASNTKILGFNASIEASRAKEAGKGFGVIAQEIRTLAETSKSSTDKMKKIMTVIVAQNDDLNEHIVHTKKLVSQASVEFGRLSTLITGVKEAAVSEADSYEE